MITRNEESKCRPTPKVAVKRAHPAAQTPAAGSDNHKINGGTKKELQRSKPQYLEQTGVRMFKEPNP